MVFKCTFNNISVISWRSVLLVVKTVVPGKIPPTYRKSMTDFITGSCRFNIMHKFLYRVFTICVFS